MFNVKFSNIPFIFLLLLISEFLIYFLDFASA